MPWPKARRPREEPRDRVNPARNGEPRNAGDATIAMTGLICGVCGVNRPWVIFTEYDDPTDYVT